MKKILSLGLAGVLALGLATSCKDDVLTVNGDLSSNSVIEDDGIRMWIAGTIALPTPTGSRSATEGDDQKPWGSTGDNDQTNSNTGTLPDYELGYDYENNIKSVLLVFANGDRDYVSHSVVSGITKTPTITADMPYTQMYDLEVIGEIKHSDLVRAYSQNGTLQGKTEPIVFVYAFCNYTNRMLERFNTLQKALERGLTFEAAYQQDATLFGSSGAKWYDWGGLVEEDPSPAGYTPLTQNSIWAENSFMMSNAKECTVKFPSDLSEWDNYADKTTPFFVGEKSTGTSGEITLTPIYVERVAARLDFKDGSDYKDAQGKKVPNTYPIWVDADGDNLADNSKEGDLNIISVQLNRMCLVNMGKEYYYLRRVSNNDQNQSPDGLSGIEHNKNWVVDYDWKAKLDGSAMQIKQDNPTGYSEEDYFNFPLYTYAAQEGEGEGLKYNRFGWYTDRIQEDFLDKDENELKEETWQNNSSGGGYYIWRYVTENTIPGVDLQQTGISTGIVFKGRIIPGADINNDGENRYMSEKVKNAITEINKEGFGKDKKTFEELSESEKAKVPHLFSYNNILYGGHEDLIKYAAADGSNGPLHHVVNQILSYWKYDAENYIYTFEQPTAADAAGLADDVLTIEAYLRIQNGQHFEGDPDNQLRRIDGQVGDPSQGEEITDDGIKDTDVIQVAPTHGVTVYRPYNEDEYDVNGAAMGDGWGYYCYYFYWNRHNDNGKSGLMGNMEFATVRNNVYKLSVESISKLGHPRFRGYDPDPVDPKDPDEDPLNYIKVEVKVLPWVVRVNKITF